MWYGNITFIYHCAHITTLVRLTDGNGSISSPRFNPQGSKLVCDDNALYCVLMCVVLQVYLESPWGGPHHTCAQLNLVHN